MARAFGFGKTLAGSGAGVILTTMWRVKLVIMAFLVAMTLQSGVATEPSAAKPRGLWFWGKPGSPYGSTNVVGNATAETEAVDTFRR